MRLSFGKNSFFLQVIINPWAFKSVPPVVEIANINSKFRNGSFFKVEELDSTEGRYKIIFDDEVKSLWKKHFDLTMLWDEAISPAVEEIKSQITYRNLNIKPGAWSLFFPGGVKKHLDRLESKSQSEGWNLLDEQASDLYHMSLIAKQKAAEVQLKAKIESFKLEIENLNLLKNLKRLLQAKMGTLSKIWMKKLLDVYKKSGNHSKKSMSQLILTIQTILVTQILVVQGSKRKD